MDRAVFFKKIYIHDLCPNFFFPVNTFNKATYGSGNKCNFKILLISSYINFQKVWALFATPPHMSVNYFIGIINTMEMFIDVFYYDCHEDDLMIYLIYTGVKDRIEHHGFQFLS